MASPPPQGGTDAAKTDDGVGANLMNSPGVQKGTTKRSHQKEENRKDRGHLHSSKMDDRTGEPSYSKSKQNCGFQTADTRRSGTAIPGVRPPGRGPGKGRPRWKPAATGLEMELIP